MAANFWNSSHYKQLLDPEEVDVVHDLDKERGISIDDFKLIKFHLSNHIMKLAQHIKVRQRVVATAITYMRRVYIRKSMVEFEPRLVALTCFYLASKAEESIQQARNLVFYIKRLYPDEYKYEVKDILGMEMKVLEALDYYLVVFHPYRSLSQSRLAQHIKIRQRVVATAVTYMRRVYTRKSLTEYEPRLVAPTCLYLACKAEESVVHAKILVFYIKKLYADEKFRYEIKDILEMEMKILEALNFYLVVFHPYRSLPEFLQDSGLNDTSMTHLTWGLVNDTYRMDLILIHPPFLITLACIYIASVHKEKDIKTWFEELSVDMNIVKNIAFEILDFYEKQRQFPEERLEAAFNKLATSQ